MFCYFVRTYVRTYILRTWFSGGDIVQVKQSCRARSNTSDPLPRCPVQPRPSRLSRAELAYGDGGRSALITPGSVLVFELELIEVQGPAAQATAEL